MGLAGAGGLLAAISTFLPWGRDAGLLAGHSRFADLDLTGQSFSGLDASGGSWVGYGVLGLGVFLALSGAMFLRRPGSGSRWFSADGATIASISLLALAATYLVVDTAPGTVAYSHGVGVYMAALGGLIAVAGAVYALWSAPYAPLRPLDLNIAWGRVAAAVIALIVIGVGTISGWTFDERLSGQLTTAQQAEVDRLQQEAKDKPETAALNTLAVGKIYNEARLSSLIILDGWNEDGGGLGLLAVVGGAVGALLVLPAVGVFGFDEHMRWRWSAIVAGVGSGVMLLGLGWVLSLLRVGEVLIVTGAGSFLVVCGGFFLMVTSRPILNEFRRKKVYDDEHLTPEAEEVMATVG